MMDFNERHDAGPTAKSAASSALASARRLQSTVESGAPLGRPQDGVAEANALIGYAQAVRAALKVRVAELRLAQGSPQNRKVA